MAGGTAVLPHLGAVGGRTGVDLDVRQGGGHGGGHDTWQLGRHRPGGGPDAGQPHPGRQVHVALDDGAELDLGLGHRQRGTGEVVQLLEGDAAGRRRPLRHPDGSGQAGRAREAVGVGGVVRGRPPAAVLPDLVLVLLEELVEFLGGAGRVGVEPVFPDVLLPVQHVVGLVAGLVPAGTLDAVPVALGAEAVAAQHDLGVAQDHAARATVLEAGAARASGVEDGGGRQRGGQDERQQRSHRRHSFARSWG